MSLADLPPLAVNFSTVLPTFLDAATIRTLPDCSVPLLSNIGICNTSLPIHARAASLINQFTLTEKLNHTSFFLGEMPRLGLPRFSFWNEALHGVASIVGAGFAENGSYSYATSFPQPILMAAAFDDEMIHDVASTISTEARAFGNVGRTGLNFFTPNVNPFRDPRWGRGFETPGEDPFHVSSYTRALLKGLEGEDESGVKKVTATCKHLAAYDLENWQNVTRFQFDAVVGTQDLAEYYVPPFEACVRDSGVGSIMCSYNALNGVPACADNWLQNSLIRDHWKWNAPEQYIISDCFALDQILVSHNYTDTPEEAAQKALQGGTDLDCGVLYPNFLPGALKQGLIEEEEVDVALNRIYSSLIKVGYFDPPDSHPYQKIGWQDVNTPEAQQLARKAATSGMVLLKNENGTLPLTASGSDGLRVLLVGEWANATIEMLGGYAGVPPFLHSPLYGLQHVEGVAVEVITSLDNHTTAATAAQTSDIVIYVGGIDQSTERETLDREVLTWKTTQLNFIRAVSSVGKPTIIVQTGGGQLDDTELLSNPNISAVLWAGYPGQDGGVAIADVLFGKVAPAGRLPITMYPAEYVSVPMTDMNLRPDGALNLGRTYKWYDSPVLPFGCGLHYTTFSVDAKFVPRGSLDITEILATCDNEERPEQTIIGHVHVSVHNTGATTSNYVALAFLRGNGGPPPYPIKELVAYERVHDLEPGCEEIVVLPVAVASLSRWDNEGRRILYPGRYTVAIDTEPELAEVAFEVAGIERVIEAWPERPQQG